MRISAKTKTTARITVFTKLGYTNKNDLADKVTTTYNKIFCGNMEILDSKHSIKAEYDFDQMKPGPDMDAYDFEVVIDKDFDNEIERRVDEYDALNKMRSHISECFIKARKALESVVDSEVFNLNVLPIITSHHIA